MAHRVPTLLATAVAAACSLSAHASGPTQADYAKVVLYSNVTIAEDSASQWGIWEELEPTAAGPQAPPSRRACGPKGRQNAPRRSPQACRRPPG